MKKYLMITFVVSALLALPQMVMAEKCKAYLYLDVTVQPKGNPYVEEISPKLRTDAYRLREVPSWGGTKSERKDEACRIAMGAVERAYRHVGNQRDLFCQSLRTRLALGEENLWRWGAIIDKEVDWYRIDKAYPIGHRVTERDRMQTGLGDRTSSRDMPTSPDRFICNGESAVILSSDLQRRTHTGIDAAPPPPPSQRTVGDQKPDLIITKAVLRDSGKCVTGKPVVYAKVTVKNVGKAVAPEVRDTAMVTAKDESINWGNGGKIKGIIPPGGSRNVKIPIFYLQRAPQSMQGEHEFRITVDPANKVSESNENNNSLDRSIRVNCR